MNRYGLPDDAWALIQPLLPAEPAIPRVGRQWAEHRMIINGCYIHVHHGASCLSDMVHGKPFITTLIGGQNMT